MHTNRPEIQKIIDSDVTLTELVGKLDMNRMPEHVAIIMDGNGRWARNRGLQREAGHVEGVETVRRITRIASDLGIGYLTLYAFSTENWNRPKAEVDALMHLIGFAIEQQLPELKRNNVRIKLVGAISRMPEEPTQRLHKAVAETAANTGMTLAICLSYSSRWEITEAVKALAAKVVAGELKADEINEQMISGAMDTAPMPDPDLLIRTGGEYRISNYLLWQAAYAELNFSNVLWPDYSQRDFIEAVLDYQGRERRYGKTGDQVSKNCSTQTCTTH